MSEKKKLKDEETEKVDGGIFPGLPAFPSPAKIKTKLPDQVEESTPDQQPGIKEQCHD